MSSSSRNNYKNIVDRPYTNTVSNFDRMTIELSKYMTEKEIDACITFMEKIKDSKFDTNPSVTDCKTQMEIMFTRDRVKQLIMLWNADNQKLLTVFGKLKYKNLKDTSDKTLYDGLDPTDNETDYEKVYV